MHAAVRVWGLDLDADLLTIEVEWILAPTMQPWPPSVFACMVVILGLGLGVTSYANLRQPNARTLPSITRVAQQSCNPKKQKCCINSDKTLVPPGTRRGPYTCLPNGTWG